MKEYAPTARRRLRSGLAAAAAALGVAAVLAGCGGGSSTSGMDGQTVKMYTWIGGDADRQQWSAYVDAGHQADPSVQVSFDGPAIGNYYTKLPTVLKGSDAPCIVTLQNGQVAPYVDGLEPLDSYAQKAGVNISDYNTAMIKQLSDNGKVYALPYGAEPNLIFYNKKMFRAAGIPDPALNWTTQDFIDAAKATTKDGQYGFAIGTGIFYPTYWMAANGEPGYVKDGKADLTDQNLAKRVQFEVDLANKYKVAKPLEAGAPGTFPDVDAFSNSQAAMMMNGTWDLQHQQQEIGKDNLGVATVPSDDGNSKGAIAGTGFAVTKSCSNKDAAFKAIAAMTSLQAQESVARSRGNVPSRDAAFGAWAEGMGQDTTQVVRQLTQNGVVSENPSNISQLNNLFTQYEVDAFAGRSTVQQVLAQVASGLGQS